MVTTASTTCAAGRSSVAAAYGSQFASFDASRTAPRAIILSLRTAGGAVSQTVAAPSGNPYCSTNAVASRFEDAAAATEELMNGPSTTTLCPAFNWAVALSASSRNAKPWQNRR
nr:hypothetical protein [Mycobacteroides abscessus]